jgi:hypothetical protein
VDLPGLPADADREDGSEAMSAEEGREAAPMEADAAPEEEYEDYEEPPQIVRPRRSQVPPPAAPVARGPTVARSPGGAVPRRRGVCRVFGRPAGALRCARVGVWHASGERAAARRRCTSSRCAWSAVPRRCARERTSTAGPSPPGVSRRRSVSRPLSPALKGTTNIRTRRVARAKNAEGDANSAGMDKGAQRDYSSLTGAHGMLAGFDDSPIVAPR